MSGVNTIMDMRLFSSVLMMFCGLIVGVTCAPIGCSPNVDLMILVDASESMIVNDPYGKPLYNWYRMKNFLTSVISELPISSAQHRVALAKYSDNVNQEFLLDQMDSSVRIMDHITNQLHHVGGNTNTAGALEWTRNYMSSAKRQSTRSVVLLFTDGQSNRNSAQTKERARELRATGAEVFTVSLDKEIDLEELYSIATSFQHVIQAPDVNDNVAWQHAVNQAVYGICDLPVPTREPPFCDVILDVGLIIDNSGSIRNESTKNENYLLLKEFVKSLIDILDITPGRTRVGALRFSTTVQTEFKLDTYMADRELMKAHIDRMQFEGSETNISGALRQARYDIFDGNHGDRPNIQNVAIVVADGESNVDQGRTRPEATMLKDEKTLVYVVAVLTQKFDEEELKFIASDPDSDHYFVSPTIRNLPAIKYNLLKHVCQLQQSAE